MKDDWGLNVFSHTLKAHAHTHPLTHACMHHTHAHCPIAEEVERRGAEAWTLGGKVAELAAKQAWREEQRRALKRTTATFAVERAQRRVLRELSGEERRRAGVLRACSLRQTLSLITRHSLSLSHSVALSGVENISDEQLSWICQMLEGPMQREGVQVRRRG